MSDFCGYQPKDKIDNPIPPTSGSNIVKKANISEKKYGEWVHREDMDFIDQNGVEHFHCMCKNCGFIHDFLDCHTEQYNFCPECGIDMRERREIND